MTRDSEIRTIQVLGEEWSVEIDYHEGKVWGIGIWNNDRDEYIVKVSDPYELQVIGKNLVNIGKELDNLSSDYND